MTKKTAPIAANLLLLALAATGRCDEVVPADSADSVSILAEATNGRSPLLTFEAGTLWLVRDRPPAVELSVRRSQTTLDTIEAASTSALGFQLEPGMRVLLGVHLNPTTSVEVSFFGLNDWTDSRSLTITATDNLTEESVSPFLGVAIVSGSQEFRYSSDVENIEVNLRRLLVDTDERRVSFLGGVRYLSLDERMVIANGTFNFVDPTTGAVTSTVGTESGVANTHNNLIGGQIGGEILEYFGPLSFGLDGTMGLYLNPANANYFHILLADGVVLPEGSAGLISDSDTQIAGVFSLGLSMGYQVNRWFSMHAGYQMLLATSIASAADQARTLVFSTDPTTGADVTSFAPGKFERNEVLFLHGPSAGIRIVW